MQRGKPILYASKSLSTTERNYAQIEKELYAIVYACKHFHHFIYGKKNIRIQSDHRPLETIFKKPITTAPARLQRMLLQLQKYNLDVSYVPGNQIPIADCLSRHVSSPTAEEEETEILKDVVHTVRASLPITDRKLSELKDQTSKDETLETLKKTIMEGWPNELKSCHPRIKEYWNHRDELTIIDDIIMKGSKMVIPKLLRNEMLEKLHSSHLGIEKTQQRARDVIFWPGMISEIEAFLKRCDTCMATQNRQTKEPLQNHPIPKYLWQRVGTDIFHWRGNNYVIIVDYLSRYFEVEKLKSMTTEATITKLKTTFSRHGIPEYVISDNGPQYSSSQFQSFAKTWGFTHITSSPRYPQSNGLSERTVQTVKRLLERTY